MTATPDLTTPALTTPALDAPDTGSPGSPVDAESAREMVSQMADVAGAMFSFLLLQTSARAVHQDIPRAPVADPPTPSVAAPAAPSFPLESVALVSIPLPVAEPETAPVVLAPPASIAMPASLPVPHAVEEPEPAAPLVAVPSLAIAADAPRTMAMLSEIGFLDD